MPELSPEQKEANALSDAKIFAHAELIKLITGATYGILSAYPPAELHTWPYQKFEAETLAAKAGAATLADAPFLTAVCVREFGEADDATRLTQVLEKALGVGERAGQWAALAAPMIGIRSRVQNDIEAATSAADVIDVLNNAREELVEMGL